MEAFNPSEHKVLASISSPALGRATEIMLRAMGFMSVDVVPPQEICSRAENINPTFIIFTPEYLSLPMEERLSVGCPCKAKVECRRAMTIIFLRKKTVDSVLMSKDMGFDGIIFADQSMERLYEALETVYETNNSHRS